MITPYLYFNGNAKEAITFYASVFNKELPKIMTLGDMPPNPNMPIPEEAKDYVMHASLSIAGGMLMFSDSYGVKAPIDSNISIMISITDENELRSYWNAIKVGAEVELELEKSFFAELFGMLTDQFGVNWQFSLERV